MKRKIFGSFCLIAIVCIVITAGLFTAAMYRQTVDRMQQSIRSEGGLLALALEGGEPVSILDAAGFVLPMNRITLIGSDGQVLYDDRVDADVMENHVSRPEVQQALQYGFGQDRRFSASTGQETFYYAQKLSDGHVLRISATVNLARAALSNTLPWVVIIGLFAVAFSLLMSAGQTRAIVEPINRLNLDDPLGKPAYDELAPLLIRINDQRKQIDRQIETQMSRQKESNEIMDHMREGLIVLGGSGQVLTVNRSAARLYGVEADAVREKNLLSIHRSPLLQQAAASALSGKPGECILSIGKRKVRVLANPVKEDDRIKGAVLLLLDDREQLRTEAVGQESARLDQD